MIGGVWRENVFFVLSLDEDGVAAIGGVVEECFEGWIAEAAEVSEEAGGATCSNGVMEFGGLEFAG